MNAKSRKKIFDVFDIKNSISAKNIENFDNRLSYPPIIFFFFIESGGIFFKIYIIFNNRWNILTFMNHFLKKKQDNYKDKEILKNNFSKFCYRNRVNIDYEVQIALKRLYNVLLKILLYQANKNKKFHKIRLEIIWK